jgi:hypothetical protein
MKRKSNDKKWFEDKFETIRLKVLLRQQAFILKDKKKMKLCHDEVIELLHEIFSNGWCLGYNKAHEEYKVVKSGEIIKGLTFKRSGM